MSGAKCPICGQPTAPQHRPFCSPRCADIDLHRWLSGGYVVPEAAGEGDPERVADDEDPD